MRLTHVHLYETNSCTFVRLTHILLLYNQSDGLRLSEQLFTRNLLLITIFHLLAYNYCNATLRYHAAIYYAAFFLFLHCIITMFPTLS